MDFLPRERSSEVQNLFIFHNFFEDTSQFSFYIVGLTTYKNYENLYDDYQAILKKQQQQKTDIHEKSSILKKSLCLLNLGYYHGVQHEIISTFVKNVSFLLSILGAQKSKSPCSTQLISSSVQWSRSYISFMALVVACSVIELDRFLSDGKVLSSKLMKCEACPPDTQK